MMNIFEYKFIQYALIASVLVGFLASYYSVFIVQRRMSFLGSGLSHASFGGVAMGLYFSIDPFWTALPFTLVVALLITWIRERTKLHVDTVVGVLFSLSMALGVVFLALRDEYSADAMTYLFGSILSVQALDLWAAGCLCLVTLACLPLWKLWAYSSFDRELALSDRKKVKQSDYFLILLIALSVVVSVKILGIILLAAFLVIPGATARLLSKRFSQMSLLSILFGVSSSIGGIFLSYWWDLPSGASIILVQSGIFFVCLLLRGRSEIQSPS